MFALETSALPSYARSSGLTPRSSNSRSDHAMQQRPAPHDLVCEALAAMTPATADEVAEAAGLDPTTAEACLDQLAARCHVMFNPLTKRFSLPKAWPFTSTAV
jgi:hypothetical protein